MKQGPVYLFVLMSLLGVISATAQTDSLYVQQWNRDPVTSLEHTASGQRQIITAKQIQASGYTRLSDVLQLIDGWTFTTITGDNWDLESNGTGSYDNPNWILMLNGQRMDVQNTRGHIAINNLGVGVADIERIEIINNAGMYLGEFATAGLIHIVTKKVANNGVSYRGFYSNDFSTITPERKVDKSSPYLSGGNTSHTLGYRKEGFQIQGSLLLHEVYNDDSILGGASYHFRNYRIEMQYNHKKFTHQIQYSYNTSDDFFNWSRYSKGVIITSLGYAGIWNINAKHQLRISANKIGTDYASNYYTVNDKLNLNYRYLTPTKIGNVIWQTGIAYSLLYPMSYLGSYHNPLPLKPYTTVTIPVSRKINVWAETQVAFAGSKVSPKFSVGMNKRVSFISNYSLVLSHATNDDYHSYFYPVYPSTFGINYTSKQATADLYYNINFGNSVKLSYNSGLKLAYDLAADEYAIGPYPYRTTVINTRQFNWINRINFHYDILKNLLFDINYMRTGIIETSNTNLRAVPKHKFTLTLQYDLPKRFSLWTRNYWQSETKWWNEPAFGTSAYSGDLYYTLPSIYTWDLGISKKLYKDYLNLNISARNLFNSTERYYPVGAQFDLRFSTSITANIDGLFASLAANP